MIKFVDNQVREIIYKLDNSIFVTVNVVLCLVSCQQGSYNEQGLLNYLSTSINTVIIKTCGSPLHHKLQNIFLFFPFLLVHLVAVYYTFCGYIFLMSLQQTLLCWTTDRFF